MHLLKRGIDAVTSATTSTRTRLSQLETKAMTSHNDLGKQLVIANEMIKIAPTYPKGYLLAGRIYLKQGNLKAALTVYRLGLDCVPTIISSYPLLKRNYDVVYTEYSNQQQRQRQQQPLRRGTIASIATETIPSKGASPFAYDIICLIFGHLSLIDLIKCTTVCESWCRFIIKWPPFWQLIESYLPQLDTELFKMYLSSTTDYGVKFIGQRPQQQAQHLLEKFPSSVAFSILEALHEYHHPLQSLVIENMSINTNPTSFLDYLQFHSSLKSIELANVSLPTILSIGHLVLGCHQVERLVFKKVPSLVSNSNIDTLSSVSNSISSLKNMTINNTPLKITYLEISLGGCFPTVPFIHNINDQLLNEIIRQCRNLRHLFLDSRDSISHGQIISTVNESCLLIKHLVISHEYQMPNTAIISNGKFKAEKKSNRNGLCRFVMAGSDNDNYYNMTSDQISSFIKKHQRTIKLLYLDFDSDTVTSQLLSRLAQHRDDKKDEITYPQLRELLINIRQPVRTTTTSSFSDSLSAFLLRCQPLQALSIINQSNATTFGGALVTDTFLQSLALRSSQLQYLRINCPHLFTTQALWRLASAANDHYQYKKINNDNNNNVFNLIDYEGDNNNGDSIETILDLDFIHSDLATVVNYWKALKNVIIRRHYDSNKLLSQSDQSIYNFLETTLRQRGGTINIKYY